MQMMESMMQNNVKYSSNEISYSEKSITARISEDDHVTIIFGYFSDRICEVNRRLKLCSSSTSKAIDASTHHEFPSDCAYSSANSLCSY